MNKVTFVGLDLSSIYKQCGAKQISNVYYTDAEENRAEGPIPDSLWDELLEKYKLRFYGQILITDVVSGGSNWETLDFVKELIRRRETVVALPVSRNFNYTNHTIQMYVWYPNGMFGSKADKERIEALYTNRASTETNCARAITPGTYPSQEEGEKNIR